MKGTRGCEQCDAILDAEGVDEACLECWLDAQRDQGPRAQHAQQSASDERKQD